MARRAAAKGTWRPRKRAPPSTEAGDGGDAAEDARPQAPAKASGGGSGFFCCYLLRSMCPRLKGRTYIGFTVNPRRRIRQHNGEISSGAWRTRNGRPWEMVLCIHGFPTNVAALQFEWAWQHPKESLAVRKAAAEFKSLSGAGNKVKLAYAMLNLPSWENLNLTVNFFSSASIKFAAGCPTLPSQMKTVVCPMEDLQCHAKAMGEDQSHSSQEDALNDGPQVHQGPTDCPHGDRQSSYIGEGTFPSDDFASMEWDGTHDLTEPDGILDLTEPDGSRTPSQFSLSSDSGGVVGDRLGQEWKQLCTDQLRPMDAQTRPAVRGVEEDSFFDDEFASIERDGILDLTEPDGILDLTEPEGSRTSPSCSLSSDSGGGDGVIEDNLRQVSPMWKVSDGSADGGDGRVVDDELGLTTPVWKGRVFEDELGQAVSPVWWKACAGSEDEPQQASPVWWKACAGSDDELRPASPVLKVGADSDSGDSAVTDDQFGQACPMSMVDAGSEEDERDVVVDLITPPPVGRLRRRAGAGDGPRFIDLTASPVVIEL